MAAGGPLGLGHEPSAKPLRLPAAVAALTMLVGLVGLQVVTHFVLDDTIAPMDYNASAFEWLARTYTGFFGPGSFDPGNGRLFLGTVVAVGVLLVVGFLGSWWGIRGCAPGSSVLPAFLSIWMVLTLFTTVASASAFVVRQSDQFGKYPMGTFVVNVLTNGVMYGVKWGWIAALLATLVWIAARPKPPLGLLGRGQRRTDGPAMLRPRHLSDRPHGRSTRPGVLPPRYYVSRSTVPYMDTTQLLKGVLDVAVLAVVDGEDGYGYDILRRLRARGLDDVGDASVYGTLRRLYGAGALTSYVVPSESGPHRKYYGMTPSGHDQLKRQRDDWEHFSTTVSNLLSSQGVAR